MYIFFEYQNFYANFFIFFYCMFFFKFLFKFGLYFVFLFIFLNYLAICNLLFIYLFYVSSAILKKKLEPIFLKFYIKKHFF